MKPEHHGTLRAKITLLSADKAMIEWLDMETSEVIWTETCSPKPGCAFVSQIECEGRFQPRSGYFIDAAGKRHFVLNAEPGRLSAAMG